MLHNPFLKTRLTRPLRSRTALGRTGNAQSWSMARLLAPKPLIPQPSQLPAGPSSSQAVGSRGSPAPDLSGLDDVFPLSSDSGDALPCLAAKGDIHRCGLINE